MEFGKVPSEDLDKINFTLPADHRDTREILPGKKSETTLHVGCAKWGRKDWIGKIYPKGTKEADFLEHYARFFNSIELNATFYRMPTEKQTSGWRKKVGDDFKFCPKFVGSITHIKRLKDVDEITSAFYRGISGFGESLGPVLLMPHPGTGPKSINVVESFIDKHPDDIELAVELRHKDWYADLEMYDRIFDILKKKNASAVITDAAGRRDCVHMRLTNRTAFIRYVGNGLHPTDYTRCDEWANRVKNWIDSGVENVYFFMHQHVELQSPELCQYFIQKLNEVAGTKLQVPKFLD